MTYSFEPVKKEFEERFVKIGKYGDIPIPPAIALRFLEKSTKEAYEQGRKDEREEVIRNIDTLAAHPLLHTDMRQALRVVGNTLEEARGEK